MLGVEPGTHSVGKYVCTEYIRIGLRFSRYIAKEMAGKLPLPYRSSPEELGQ